MLGPQVHERITQLNQYIRHLKLHLIDNFSTQKHEYQLSHMIIRREKYHEIQNSQPYTMPNNNSARNRQDKSQLLVKNALLKDQLLQSQKLLNRFQASNHRNLVRMFYTRVTIFDSLPQLYANIQDDNNFEKYAIYRSKMGESLIFLNLNDYQLKTEILSNIDSSSIEEFRQILKFKTYSHSKHQCTLTYFMVFENQLDCSKWTTFLKEQTSLHYHISQESPNKLPYHKWRTVESVKVAYESLEKIKKHEQFDILKHEQHSESTENIAKPKNISFSPSFNLHLKEKNRFRKKPINAPSYGQKKQLPIKEQRTHKKSVQFPEIQTSQINLDSPVLSPSKLLQKIHKKNELVEQSGTKQAIYWIEENLPSPVDFEQLNSEINSSKSYSNKKSEKFRRDSFRPKQLNLTNSVKKGQRKSTQTNNYTTNNPSSDTQSKDKLEIDKSQRQITSYRDLSESENTISQSPSKRSKKDYLMLARKQSSYIHLKEDISDLQKNQPQQLAPIRQSHNSTQKNKSKGQSQSKRSQTVQINKANLQQQEFESASQQSQISSMSSSDVSQQMKLDLQELKNGIVLWKFSQRGIFAHEKKLSLSRNQLELCYCDIKNSLDEKKAFIRDIIQISVGEFGKGIAKHRTHFDQQRCMVVRIKVGKKEKIWEFMVSDTEPVEKLLSFHEKIHKFWTQTKQNKQQL